MNTEKIMKLFTDTSYIRVSCSSEEHCTAEYLKTQCAELGLEPRMEPFSVTHGQIRQAILSCDGQEIPCKGYECCGNGEIEAPLYYLPNKDPWSLSQCRGKIVLLDGYLDDWTYLDLVENGAFGFITYDGSINYADEDISQRRLRPSTHPCNRIPGVNINAKSAAALIRKGVSSACISIQQEEYEGISYNVIADIPGEREDTILFTAHYDTTSLSVGAYDNMSGCIGLLAMAEFFQMHKPKYSLRFLWCGSEELGLLGSRAFVETHKEELKKYALCINLDMIGTGMGKFRAVCTAEKKLVSYLEYTAMEYGFGLESVQDVYSSDSTPLADQGVPAVTFVRWTTPSTGTIHNRYDTIDLISPQQMSRDIDFITFFADRMANAAQLPVSREIPEKMKVELDDYMCRKRKPKEE
ncbi:MAG: M28 family metallopeptidase [Anaerovoracaceae bacterium]